MSEIRRLWPQPAATLSDDDLLDAYAMPADRALLRINFISSVDGAATQAGRSGTLGDAADLRVFDLLRVPCDALMVAAGTLRVEQYGPMTLADPFPRLRSAQGRSPHPVLVPVTRSLDLDPGHALFSQAPVRPLILTTANAARERGAGFAEVADVLTFGESEVDLAAALAHLFGMGLRHVLCEGGPHLLGALLQADLVDELCLTLAPKLVGPAAGRIVAGSSSVVHDLTLVHVLQAGDEILLRYQRER